MSGTKTGHPGKILVFCLRIDDMDEVAVEFTQRLMNLNKEACQWLTYEFLEIEVCPSLETLMPLITDLRDESIRHAIGTILDFKSKEFNEQKRRLYS